MDRFIAVMNMPSKNLLSYLKSSMDRFIVVKLNCVLMWKKDLKSSMDRFIVSRCSHAGMEA